MDVSICFIKHIIQFRMNRHTIIGSSNNSQDPINFTEIRI